VVEEYCGLYSETYVGDAGYKELKINMENGERKFSSLEAEAYEAKKRENLGRMSCTALNSSFWSIFQVSPSVVALNCLQH